MIEEEVIQYTHYGCGDVSVKCTACKKRLCACCYDVLTPDDDLFCIICSISCATISPELAYKQRANHEYKNCIEVQK